METEFNFLLCQRVCGWVIFWYTFYRAMKKIFRSRHPEYSCRIVTLLHAVGITSGACYVTFFHGTNPYESLGLKNTAVQMWIVTVSLGYFLYDFSWCLYFQTEGPVMLLHHVISITFMTVCLHLGVSGTEVVATIFGTEITSIFLNVRWFLKEHDHYSGSVEGLIVDALFVLLFLAVRIGVGGHLAVSVWLSTTSPVLIKFGGGLFYGINCVFLIQIFSFARYRLRTWTKPTKTTNRRSTLNSVPVKTNKEEKTRNGSFTNHCAFESGDHALIKRSFELQAPLLAE